MSKVKNDVQSICDADESKIASSLITSNSDSNNAKETPARSMLVIRNAIEWDAVWSLVHLADFPPSETTALPKQMSMGAQSSASLKESHSNMNQFSHQSLLSVVNKTPMATPVQSAVPHPMNTSENTAQTARIFSTENIHAIGGSFASHHTMQVITQPSGIKKNPNSIMASNSSVNPHQPFSSDSQVQVASSTTKNISKPQPSLASSMITQKALPKQMLMGAQSSALLKESHSNMNQFSHQSLLSVVNKTPMATPVQSAVPHPMNTSENTAQTARVFSTGNIHAIGGSFASHHTMQVITQPSGIKKNPNSIMASNSSVNPHQPFSSDSQVQVASSTTKNISKPQPSLASSMITQKALPKQMLMGAQSSALLKESHSNMNQFSHQSLLSVVNKTPMATPVQSAVPHPMNTSENTAQTARVFSTGNVHAIGGIFASHNTMQVISQPSFIKRTPNFIMPSNSSVQPFSVNSHQHGQIHVLAPTSNTYALSITTTSKPFCSDSLLQVASSTTRNISKPHPVSALALVSPQTMVGVSHSSAGMSLNNNAAIADMITPRGSSGSLNLSQSPVKGNSVLSLNKTVAVKNNLSTNSVAASASHSNTIATLHVSKAHSQVIQSSLTSSKGSRRLSSILKGSRRLSSILLASQGDVCSPAPVSNEPVKIKAKKKVRFSFKEVYYFKRIQGSVAVPSKGGCSLGMEKHNYAMKIFSLNSQGKMLKKCPSRPLLSDGNSTDEDSDLDECAELKEENKNKIKPLSEKKRCALLRASGVQKFDYSDNKDCNLIRTSRQDCGCECKTTCDPNTCFCSINGIKCQEDIFSYPCGCSRDSCDNPHGRVEYNKLSIKEHFQKTVNSREAKK